MAQLDEWRREKDRFFGHAPDSPLRDEQKEEFDGLDYYPENASLRLKLPLDTTVAHDVIEMKTTAGSTQHYRREGAVSFDVEGQRVKLYLYKSDESPDLFIPFRDATSGNETYSGGRYLEAHLNQDGTVDVDFNYAYNPYCAYNGDWSCPIPPVENWLPAPIRAGEMEWQ